MSNSSRVPAEITEDWCAHHFDPADPRVGESLHDTLRLMRSHCPVAHSDQHGGFWVLTRYEDVVRVAQDWESFTTEEGLTVPTLPHEFPFLPEEADPPQHRSYRRIINPMFTPAWVEQWAEPTRDLINRMLDGFIASGECEFMADFARPFPSVAFFDLVMNAPREDIAWLSEMATVLTIPSDPRAYQAWASMIVWVREFVDRRRGEQAKGDFVDAIISSEIDGRPISDDEIVGMVWLLMQGGLETTSGALGQFMIRFCRDSKIPALLRSRPELVPEAVEELMRLDAPFVMVARTARRDTEIDGRQIKAGEKVVISWASANLDDTEFAEPEIFDPMRRTNRHVTFGAGPHRCVGSHLARMNLRIAVQEIIKRLDDLSLQDEAEPIPFHSAWNRAPLRVPIRFTARR